MNYCLVAICLSLTLVSPLGAAASETVPGYTIEQTCKMLGESTITLAPNALRFFDHGKSIVLITKAPKWNVIICNLQAHTYCESKLENFSGNMTRGFTVLTGHDFTNVTFNAPEKSKDGLLLYGSTDDYTRKEIAFIDGAKHRNDLPKTVQLSINPTVAIAPQAALLLSRTYSLPKLKGMPIRLIYVNFNKERKCYLNTTLVSKKSIPLSDFEHPASYTKVASAKEVYRSQAQDEELGDILEGIRNPDITHK